MRFLSEPEPPRGVATAVAPGVRRMVAPNPGPMTCWGTNTYLIETDAGTLVLDPGPDDAGHVAAVAAVAGRVRAILLSHTHPDHLGGVAALRAATGAPVHSWHAPALGSFVPDVSLRDRDQAFGWTALHTPGHAPDHLCFAGPSEGAIGGVLASADHVMGWSSTVVIPPDGRMADYFASLERLLGREDRLYLPGHGPPIPEPLAHVRALRAHRLAREAAVLAALGPVPRTVEAIVGELYAEVSPTLHRAAGLTVAAHLGKLAEEGRAAEVGTGWVAAAGESLTPALSRGEREQ